MHEHGSHNSGAIDWMIGLILCLTQKWTHCSLPFSAKLSPQYELYILCSWQSIRTQRSTYKLPSTRTLEPHTKGKWSTPTTASIAACFASIVHDMEMEFDMAMDMMSQEQLMHIISQLDSALASSPSPSTSPSASPPRQSPAAQVPVLPAGDLLNAAAVSISRAQPAPPALHPVAAMAAVQSSSRGIMYTTTRQGVIDAAEEEEAAAPRPRRRNARVSSEPQSVAARLRRERVSQRMRALQRLVPGGARLDTASMLEEAIRYVKFLKGHVQSLERAAAALHMHGGHAAAAGFSGDAVYSCPSYYA